MTGSLPGDQEFLSQVEDSAISVCIFDAQCMGQLAYVIRYPILDLAVFESFMAVLLLHSDACDASTQHSSPPWLGLIIKPLSCVPSRYLPILFTASACLFFGFAENLAHWWTAHDMSGLVDFSR